MMWMRWSSGQFHFIHQPPSSSLVPFHSLPEEVFEFYKFDTPPCHSQALKQNNLIDNSIHAKTDHPFSGGQSSLRLLFGLWCLDLASLHGHHNIRFESFWTEHCAYQPVLTGLLIMGSSCIPSSLFIPLAVVQSVFKCIIKLMEIYYYTKWGSLGTRRELMEYVLTKVHSSTDCRRRCNDDGTVKKKRKMQQQQQQKGQKLNRSISSLPPKAQSFS